MDNVKLLSHVIKLRNIIIFELKIYVTTVAFIFNIVFSKTIWKYLLEPISTQIYLRKQREMHLNFPLGYAESFILTYYICNVIEFL